MNVGSTRGEAQASLYAIGGMTIIVLVVLGVLFWSCFAEVSAAVVARGTVVVESDVRTVQHARGGVVTEVRVKPGDRVQQGDLLARFDDRTIQSQLAIIRRQWHELRLKIARLVAERDGHQEIVVPPDLLANNHDERVREMIGAAQELLASRHTLASARADELRRRVIQLANEVDGIRAQLSAQEQERLLVQEELDLLDRGAGDDVKPQPFAIRRDPRAEVSNGLRRLALKRELARIEAERSQSRLALQHTESRITETELQIKRNHEEARQSVLLELNEAQAKVSETSEVLRDLEQQLAQLEVRAQVAGAVNPTMSLHEGRIVAAGEVLMMIVPEADRLVVDARVEPHEVDQVLESESAIVRFSAFNQRVTPEVKGRLVRISADLVREKMTHGAYFLARVEFTERDLKVLDGKKLVPGMPAEVFIATRPRSALSYFLKPLSDQFARAWRER